MAKIGVADSSPFIADSGPFIADSGPFIADSGLFMADPGPFMADSGLAKADQGPIQVCLVRKLALYWAFWAAAPEGTGGDEVL